VGPSSRFCAYRIRRKARPGQQVVERFKLPRRLQRQILPDEEFKGRALDRSLAALVLGPGQAPQA
jgi:hypothetical protein